MPAGTTVTDPSVHRRRLRNELRKAREARGMTQREVAKAMDWSQSKLIRIETGTVNISTNDLRALLNHYGAEQERITSLVEMARSAREQTPWNAYRTSASSSYINFCGQESSASVIRNFEPILVPGLLQTEEYAQGALSVIMHERSDRIDSLVDLRMQRQELVTRPDAPSVHFIMDESVIYREIGGPAVSRRQLRKLLELSELPNVTIRIVPFTAGMYPRMRTAYVLLEFPDPEDEDVLYVENPEEEDIIREGSVDPADLVNPVRFLEIFWQLEQVARREDFPGIVERRLSVLERQGD